MHGQIFHKYSLFLNMLINVDISFKDNFSACILRWIPPCGKIGDCQQISRDCYAKTLDFRTPLFAIVANKIYEYNQLTVKQCM